MSWVEVFNVYLVCHCVGDFLLQTEFQATRKAGGLGRETVAGVFEQTGDFLVEHIFPGLER